MELQAYITKAENMQTENKLNQHGAITTSRIQEKGSQAKDKYKFAFEVLDPQAMWQRICERHRKGESDISELAERRKSE